MLKPRSRIRCLTLLSCLSLVAAASAQGPATGNSKLAIADTPVPPATPQQPYRFQLVAKGGIPPMKWEHVQGELPPGIRFSPDGVISGTPTSLGEFHFTVEVTDTSRPAQTATRDFVLKILAPLLLEWKNYPKVQGNQILGSVMVTNGTENIFDFTLIVVAVNEIGKAFALGYQRFPLRPGTLEFEIQFGQGQNLPQGKYVVHADGVGEVDATGSIYHRRLQSKEAFTIAVGP
jgi:Putative Ig domain